MGADTGSFVPVIGTEGVLVPYEVVVPYSKNQLELAPPSTAVPLSTAELLVRFVTPPVTGPVWPSAGTGRHATLAATERAQATISRRQLRRLFPMVKAYLA